MLTTRKLSAQVEISRMSQNQKDTSKGIDPSYVPQARMYL
jgi:hypothetical protein